MSSGLRARRGLLFVVIALALVALAACGGDDSGDGDDATPTPGTTPGPENCGPNMETAVGETSWLELFPGQVYEEDAWRVLRGQADSPFLSVSLDREVVGSIELLQFPLESSFDPEAGIEALEEWTSEYYAGVEEDRTGAYESYVLESRAPEAANVGTFCGIAYGYTGTDGGEVVDRLAGYATFDRGNLYLMVAQYDAGQAGELGFQDPETLQEFEPVFANMAPQLSLPPGGGGPTPTPAPDAGDEATPEG